MDEPDHVLVPSLGDADDADALTYALERYPAAAVTLQAVVTPLDSPLSEGRVVEREDERVADARRRAETIVGSVADPSRVTIEVREGRPTAVVPEYVHAEGIDHVVVSGHDAGIIERMLGSGIAEAIEERTAVPVTVVE